MIQRRLWLCKRDEWASDFHKKMVRAGTQSGLGATGFDGTRDFVSVMAHGKMKKMGSIKD